MNKPTKTIEVDEATARVLEARASETGTTVAAVVSDLIRRDAGVEPASEEELRELDRRWQRIAGGEPTIAHEEVKAWLATWGTPDFRPWRR
jgi:hypothetical protein